MNEFPQTRLSVIERIRLGDDDARLEALDVFVRAYRPALIDYLVRARGIPEHNAEDLVSDFILNKIMQGNVLDLANGKGRFRNVLRTCIKMFFIDDYRKKQRLPKWVATSPEIEQPELRENEIDPFDRVWAIAVLGGALSQMQSESPHWGLFVDRVLTQPPKPYDQVILEYGFDSPKKASNVLITARRTFNRMLSSQIEAQNWLSTNRSDGEASNEADLLRILSAEPNALHEAFAVVHQHASSESEVVVLSSDAVVIREYEFLGSTANDVWGKSEVGSVFKHLLGQQLTELRIGGVRTSGVTLGETLNVGSLVDGSELVCMKNHFNQRGRSADTDLPQAINVAMTFAIMCRFVLDQRALDEITSMTQCELIAGIGQLENQSWLPSVVNEVLVAARNHLLGP